MNLLYARHRDVELQFQLFQLVQHLGELRMRPRGVVDLRACRLFIVLLFRPGPSLQPEMGASELA